MSGSCTDASAGACGFGTVPSGVAALGSALGRFFVVASALTATGIPRLVDVEVGSSADADWVICPPPAIGTIEALCGAVLCGRGTGSSIEGEAVTVVGRGVAEAGLFAGCVRPSIELICCKRARRCSMRLV